MKPDEALREAAQEVVRRAEFDDNFEGEYVDFLVPADALERLRAALALAVPVAGGAGNADWRWRCADCRRVVPPMGMCETCGVFGIYTLDKPDANQPVAEAGK